MGPDSIIGQCISITMVIIGDFNDLLYVIDKKGTNHHPQNLMDGFWLVLVDKLIYVGEVHLGEKSMD